MQTGPAASFARYGLAAVVVAIAVVARLALEPWLGTLFPFTLLYLAVLLVAWLAGTGPALFATVLGALGAARFLLVPRGLLVTGFDNQAGLLLYMVTGLGIALLGGAMRGARQRAEALAAEAVRQREELRVTLASIGDGVIVSDAQGRVASLNPVAERLTAWSAAEAQGRPLKDVFRVLDEGTRAEVGSPVERVLQDGNPAGLEGALLLARDGSERPVDDSAAPIRDEQGRLLGVVLTFRDVSERRRAEQGRNRLAAIVESSDDAIVSKSLDGTITSWNAAATRLYGYSAEEMLGRPITLLTPPERSDEMAQILARVERGEWTNHFQTVRRHKDGRQIEVSVNISPIVNDAGQLVGASTIARDITEELREQREIERLNRDLQRRIAEFQTLLDVVPVGIAVAETGVAGRTWTNPALDRLLHLAGGAEHWPSLQLDPPEASRYEVYRDGLRLSESQLPMQVAAATGEEVQDVELEVTLPDATRVELLSSAAPLFDEAGQVRGVIGVAVDISARKRAEAALRDSVLRLEQVEQRLRESDRRKDHFLAVLAHELRNPLAPIRNALRILQLAGSDGPVGSEARDVAERQIHHLTRLVDDLLDVSRIVWGKIALRKERVDLALVVYRALESARPSIEMAGHELTMTLPPEPIWLDADPVRMAQVLSNLLNNAAKYTRPPGRIWLTAEIESGEAVLRVRDTGVGVAPEMLPRIFDVFTQAGPADTHSEGGLGVGLTLVKTLVEMHGGRVEATSPGIGRGSEFVVRLPAGARLEPRAPSPEPQEPQPAPARRILVVDDNIDAAQSLAVLLTLEGHAVQVAHSGRAALEAFGAGQPEWVFLDIGMPDLDGYEVARAMRELPGAEETVLVALTGWGQEEHRQRSKAAGFDHHLIKPIEPDLLQQLLAGPSAG